MSLAPQIRLPFAAFCCLLPLWFLVHHLSRWVFEAISLLTLFWLIWCLWRGAGPGKAPASSTTGLDAAHKCDGQPTIRVSLAQVEGGSSQITLASGPTPGNSDASRQSLLDVGPENHNSSDEDPLSITSTTRRPPSSSEPEADRAYSPAATEEQDGTNPYADRPYTPDPPRANVRNGKSKAMQDEVYDQERPWVVREVQGGAAPSVGEEREAGLSGGASAMDGDGEAEDRGSGGSECQCCFAYYPFGEMVQCPEAHLFCPSCTSTYAATKLGADDCSINCMHPSGCVLPFPPSELERALHPKLMSHYESVKRQNEVEAASSRRQEKCKEKLFIGCGNEDGPCGVCGMCQEGDLLSKSCKEVEEDKPLDGRHVIEEAMTRALIRNCPKCEKAFVKELGCNKMTCPKCQTLSCYICRQVITDYEHFDQWSISTSTAGSKCVLWDSVEERHADEVGKAAEKALLEYKQAHPDVDESAIKVDLPPGPPRTDDCAPGLPGHVPAFPYPFPGLYPPGYNPYAANIFPPAGRRGPAYDPLYQPPYFGPPVPVERNQNQYPMFDRLRQHGFVQPAAPAPVPALAPIAGVQADRGAVLLQEMRQARLQREEQAAQAEPGPLPRKVRREMAKMERKREREEQRVAAARQAQVDLAVRLREMRAVQAQARAQVEAPMGTGGAGVGGGDGGIGERRMGAAVQTPAALVRRTERKR